MLKSTTTEIVSSPVDDAHESSSPVDEHVFLTGRPPMGEVFAFVTANTVGGNSQVLSELANRWRVANDHIRALQISEATFADSPTLGEIPPELHPLCTLVLDDPIFQRSFQIVP